MENWNVLPREFPELAGNRLLHFVLTIDTWIANLARLALFTFVVKSRFLSFRTVWLSRSMSRRQSGSSGPTWCVGVKLLLRNT